MSEPVHIVITANSPGEVAGWLTPAVAALKARPWRSHITVFVPPCTFASGAECDVVRTIPGVDVVAGPGEFLRYVALGRPPHGFHPPVHGVVLFLGGELTYAVLLAKRLRYPLIAYTEGFANWTESLDFFATPYPQTASKLATKGVPEEKVRVIGNLMLDAAQPRGDRETVRAALGVAQRPLLLLMPGSRPAEVEYMAPFFLEVAEQVAAEVPGVATALSISTFVNDERFSAAVAGPAARDFGRAGSYTPGREGQDEATDWEAPGLVVTEGGMTIQAFRRRQYDLMAAADLALTIPGTNTAELSFHGVPMVVALPLNHPERIPLEGLVGLIGSLPRLGKEFKRRMLPRLLAKMRFAAWPNRLAGEFIVPEIRGKIVPDDLARVVSGLLSDPGRRQGISHRLREVIGEPGAATTLAQLIEEVLTERFGAAWRQV